jgi:hypothetical protein
MGDQENEISEDQLEINRLAYEEGLKALNGQEKILDNIRQRASGIAALSGLSATFLGKEALKHFDRSSKFTVTAITLTDWIAIFLFVFSILMVVQILRPRKGWIFHFGPSDIIDQFAKGPQATSLSNTYEELAKFSEENYKKNDIKINNLFKWFWASLVSVILQIILWLISIPQ